PRPSARGRTTSPSQMPPSSPELEHADLVWGSRHARESFGEGEAGLATSTASSSTGHSTPDLGHGTGDFHRRLLRARRERPRRRRAANERDELAAFHSITSSARSRNDSGSLRPSALAAVRLTTSSNFARCSTGSSPAFAPRRSLSTYPPARRNKSGIFGP